MSRRYRRAEGGCSPVLQDVRHARAPILQTVAVKVTAHMRERGSMCRRRTSKTPENQSRSDPPSTACRARNMRYNSCARTANPLHRSRCPRERVDARPMSHALIIDDDANASAALAELVADEGFTTSTAAS